MSKGAIKKPVMSLLTVPNSYPGGGGMKTKGGGPAVTEPSRNYIDLYETDVPRKMGFFNIEENDVNNDAQPGLTFRLAFAVIAAALGSAFQHGYNTGVINSPKEVVLTWISDVSGNRTGLRPDKDHVDMIWAILVSIFCFGGLIGGGLIGFFAERYGRRGGLLLNNGFVFISAILQGCAEMAGSFEMIIFGRFFAGICSGLNAGLVPMYLAEISPSNLRGAIGTVYQLVVTISILVSQIMGMQGVWGTPDMWPMLLAFIAFPAIFQLCTLPLCPESPKYLLLAKKNEDEAYKALKWLRGRTSVRREMDDMLMTDDAGSSIFSIKELVTSPSLRDPLIVAIMIMVSQQLSGVNAIFFYSTEIFKLAALSEANAQYATLGMGAINVVMTLISLFLVERAGRKTLLLVGLCGMCVDTFLIAIGLHFAHILWVSYFSIFLVFLYVILFAAGLGSIPWFLVSEIFNQQARPPATTLAVSVNWFSNFVVGLGFPLLTASMDGWVFIIFTILLIGFAIFVYKKVPETKNKTPEEVAVLFRQNSYDTKM